MARIRIRHKQALLLAVLMITIVCTYIITKHFANKGYDYDRMRNKLADIDKRLKPVKQMLLLPEYTDDLPTKTFVDAEIIEPVPDSPMHFIKDELDPTLDNLLKSSQSSTSIDVDARLLRFKLSSFEAIPNEKLLKLCSGANLHLHIYYPEEQGHLDHIHAVKGTTSIIRFLSSVTINKPSNKNQKAIISGTFLNCRVKLLPDSRVEKEEN